MGATLKILGRTVLAGWIVLFISGFLIVEFPNAIWNHALSSFTWYFGISLTLASLAFCAFVAFRLAVRIFGGPTRSPASNTARSPLPSPISWSRRLAIGSLAVLAMAIFVGLLLVVVERHIRSSVPYQISVARALDSPRVLSIVGHPVSVGWFVTGQIVEVVDGRGRANLAIPLRGPNGSGTLRVDAVRQTGNWQISVLQFIPRGGNSLVDLSQRR
jgi:NADH:ubiquinone oxidoreductase subunit 5 (subunit L)/multisubunit Na+/H+ antiporter MnhA subunit